jgi:hypothetical protein
MGIAAISVKSSQTQQIGINQLDGALKNVGASYAAQGVAIEKVIEAQQRKTNFGDEEQRDALRELVLVSGDYEKSLAAMIPMMDLAAGKNMDLGAAATLVARAISGEETALTRYGISVEKGAGATAVLTEIMAKFGGQAEDAADPMIMLKNRVGDLSQSIGDVLAPVILELLPKIELMVRDMIAWTEAHPTLTKVLVVVAASLGAVMLVLGPMLLILPQLVMGLKLFAGGIKIVTLAMAANPIGALVAILTTLAIVALPLVIKHWDRIWFEIKKTTETVVNFVIGLINKMTFLYRTAFSKLLDLVKSVFDKIPNFVKNAIPGLEEFGASLDGVQQKLEDGIPTIDIVGDTFEATSKQTQQAAEKVEEAVTHQAVAVEQSADRQIVAANQAADAQIEAQKRTTDAIMKNAQDRVDAAKSEKDRINGLLDTMADKYDETNLRWERAGLNMDKVLQGWAMETGRSVQSVIAEWQLMELDLDDTEMVIRRFKMATGKDLFEWSTDNERNIKRVRDAAAELETKFGDLRHAISQSADEDFAENWESITAPTGISKPRIDTTASQAKAAADVAAKAASSMEYEKWSSAYAAQASSPSRRGVMNSAQLDRLTETNIKNMGWSRERSEAYSESLAISGYAQRAGGGLAGGLTLVGERGPELVSLPHGSFVHPNGTGPRNQSNTFVFNGAVYGVEDLRQVVVEAVRDHAIAGGFSGVFAEA